MARSATSSTAEQTATIGLTVGGERLQLRITAPTGPADPGKLLPEFQKVANAVVDVAVRQAEAQGLAVSCRKGCGACCRQLVPISESEARQLRALITSLPSARKAEVFGRFAAARQRLEKAGLLARLHAPGELDDRAVVSLGLQYFALGIACPFLEAESCSIHPQRPIACREYLVTSPAENCARPGTAPVVGVQLPAKVSQAVRRLEADGATPRWVPLIIAPEWAEAYPAGRPRHTGLKLVEMLFSVLARSPSLPIAGAAMDAQTRRAATMLPRRKKPWWRWW